MKILKFIKKLPFIRSFRELDRRLFIVVVSELLLIISISIIFLLSSLFLKTSLNTLGITNEFIEKVNENKDNQTFTMDFLKGQMKYTSPQKFQSFLINLISSILISLIINLIRNSSQNFWYYFYYGMFHGSLYFS